MGQNERKGWWVRLHEKDGKESFMLALNISIALRVFVPFAAGYLISYLFRAVNGTLRSEWSANSAGAPELQPWVE